MYTHLHQDVLPDHRDRMSVVLLGFSDDGEKVIGYREGNLLLWEINCPRNIVLTDVESACHPYSVKPWLRVPFPPISHNDEGGEAQVELEVLQSRDTSLLVMFCSSFNSDEADRAAAVTLVPSSVESNALNVAWVTFPIVFMNADVNSRHIVDVSKHRYLLVLSCGDMLRFIKIKKNIIPPESPSMDGLDNEASTYHSFHFPVRIQIVEPERSWWCSSQSLDHNTSQPRQVYSSLPGGIAVEGQTSFEVEPFLGDLLATQLRKLDGIIEDYVMSIVDPHFKCSSGIPLVQIAVVIKVCRRVCQLSFEHISKRRRDTNSTRLACLLGVCFAIDPACGKVAILKSVHLKPPHAQSGVLFSAGSSKMLKRLNQRFISSFKRDQKSNQKGGRRLSNAAVLKSNPISVLENPVFPIGIAI